MSNNDFLSYQGTISRKNYIINLLILVLLYAFTSLIRFDALLPYIKFQFLYTVLIFLVELFKFVLLISALSVIYRRISDFSNFNTFNTPMKWLFSIFYLFPFIYMCWVRYLFMDIMPKLTFYISLATVYIILPITLILTVVFAFLKSK